MHLFNSGQFVSDKASNLPKYQQLMDYILTAIDQGKLIQGSRLPSINELSEMLSFSRDTIERTYRELKSRGIIDATRGKGYFITSTLTKQHLKVFLLFNKVSAYKKLVYYSLLNQLQENASVDLRIYHYNPNSFRELLQNNLGKYHYYLLMCHFRDDPPADLVNIIEQIPRHQLIVLDKDIPGLSGEYHAIYQDFSGDIVKALYQGMELLKKYNSLNLIFPTNSIHPVEIIYGFRNFCKMINHKCSVEYQVNSELISPGHAYLVIDEDDLVEFLKICKLRSLVPGKDIGLISYNDSPLKEVLAGGITVISTDFTAMGKTAADLVLGKVKGKIMNPFHFYQRNTL
jgi:DNA-binding transcriptional regulator YhcF (GntR family)